MLKKDVAIEVLQVLKRHLSCLQLEASATPEPALAERAYSPLIQAHFSKRWGCRVAIHVVLQ